MSARGTVASAFALAACMAGTGAARAASAGGETFDFLTLDAGARPAAMGDGAWQGPRVRGWRCLVMQPSGGWVLRRSGRAKMGGEASGF